MADGTREKTEYIHTTTGKKVKRTREKKTTRKEKWRWKNDECFGGGNKANSKPFRLTQQKHRQDADNRCKKREHEMIADCRLRQFFRCARSKPMDPANDKWNLHTLFVCVSLSLSCLGFIFVSMILPIGNIYFHGRFFHFTFKLKVCVSNVCFMTIDGTPNTLHMYAGTYNNLYVSIFEHELYPAHRASQPANESMSKFTTGIAFRKRPESNLKRQRNIAIESRGWRTKTTSTIADKESKLNNTNNSKTNWTRSKRKKKSYT